MKIALFTDTFPPEVNGVSHTVYASACALAAQGHSVTVYTISKLSEEELNEKFGNNFNNNFEQTFTIKTLPSSPAFAYPDARMSLPIGFTLPSIHANKPDVIHVHTPFAAGWEGVWASKLYDIPLVGTHHTFFNHYLDHIHLDYHWAETLTWKLTTLFYNRCDMVLSPTCSLRDELALNDLKSPVTLLANSIDTKLFHTSPSHKVGGGDALTLVYMGRLSYEKSIDETLIITAELIQKYPDVKLKIIGDGPERAKLEQLAADLGITDHVTFTGFLYKKDLVDALTSSDIYVTTSKSENMPLAVLQAMAVGLPIIALSSLGMTEIVQDEENGFLITQGDIEKMRSDMMAKIALLFTDAVLRDKMAEKSRELSEQYSEDVITHKLLKVYSEVIKNNE